MVIAVLAILMLNFEVLILLRLLEIIFFLLIGFDLSAMIRYLLSSGINHVRD